MQQNTVGLTIKKSACLLTILTQTSCCTASATSIQIRCDPGSAETGPIMLPDRFNNPELICHIRDDQTTEWSHFDLFEYAGPQAVHLKYTDIQVPDYNPNMHSVFIHTLLEEI